MPSPSSTCPFHEVLFSNFATATIFFSVAACAAPARSSAAIVRPKNRPTASRLKMYARIWFLLIIGLLPSTPARLQQTRRFFKLNLRRSVGRRTREQQLFHGLRRPKNLAQLDELVSGVGLCHVARAERDGWNAVFREIGRIAKPRCADGFPAKSANERMLGVGVQRRGDADHLHLSGQMFAQMTEDFIMVLAGDRAAIDFDFAVVWDDVHLRTAANNADIGCGRTKN